MAKSIDKILAEATARGAAEEAKRNPGDKKMQDLAAKFAERARKTK